MPRSWQSEEVTHEAIDEPRGLHIAPRTVAQIRELERRTMETVPEATLMARAARAVADEIAATLADTHHGVRGARVAILAGSGNNGGDALLAGALLAVEGANVVAIAVGGRLHESSADILRSAGGIVTFAESDGDLLAATEVVIAADVVIDGIVGLGARPGLRSPADRLVSAIPDEALVVAVDLPSGLDADSGAADSHHVEADVTVTFTAPKMCLVTAPASHAAGRVVIADVGVSLEDATERR